MNSKKKQSVAVAMATALGVSAMMSPVAVHALEEDSATAITQESNQQESTQEVKSQNDTPVSKQGLPASEQPQVLNTDSLSSGKPIVQSRANEAFTNNLEAKQAIETALADYPVSNATTQQEINDFLEREFIATGKLGNINTASFSKKEATSKAAGNLEIDVQMDPVVSGSQFSLGTRFSSFLIIPRLPKTGEVAIDKANFPDDTFRKYVSDNFDDDNDDVLSVDEISNVTGIGITNNPNLKSLKGIEHFTALKNLNCHDIGISSLDVSKNTALEFLDCSNTGIQTLDVSNNPDLQKLFCYNTGIQTLDVSNNTDLTILSCFNTGIQTLNVSNNTALYTLDCHNTGIQTLDVSNNIALTNLHCHNTGIQTLNVSNNTALNDLYCYKTGIQTLDVSNNTALYALECYNTGIQTLDVSKNTALNYLDCSNTPLAWLSLGTGHNFYQGLYIPNTSNIDLAVTSDSFDMTQAFPDIDISKVKNITGATLNGNSITGYTLGKPITYTYDCGTAQGNSVTLDVTLNLVKSDSDIRITGTLDTTYTGKPIDNPSVKIKGSTGAVTFTYELWTGTGWEVVNGMPINAGKYRIQAKLAGDDYYNEAVSGNKEFTILPKNIKDGNITVSDINSDNDVKKLSVKDDDRELVKGTDYDVETKKVGNKTIVTITFKGNYAGTIKGRILLKQASQKSQKMQTV